MLVGFYDNFTPDDLICKVVPSGAEVPAGAGASLQLNANECLQDASPHVDLCHRGVVTVTTPLSREELVRRLRIHARSSYEALGGNAILGAWPLFVGSTRSPGTLLDTLFLYAFGVEQVKRALRSESPLPTWRLEDRQKYWLTVHWPPLEGSDLDPDVFLAEGTQAVGEPISRGDLVWIFESKTGRERHVLAPDGTRQAVAYRNGRRGVVGLSKIAGPLRATDVPLETYADGSTKWWRWNAPGEFVRNSSPWPVPRASRVVTRERYAAVIFSSSPRMAATK